MGRRVGIVGVLLACFVAVMPSASAASQPVTAASYRLVTGGTRDYWLYTPAGAVPKGGRPLVVYLHGCSQNNATDPPVAFGTRWNELAAKVGAVVLYPLQAAYNMEQPERAEGNGGSCWNWFLPQNFYRGKGEPKLIVDLTRDVARANYVDTSRVYVMGVSAGADLANTLSITYPDVFRASALFAGCAYMVCRDVLGNQARQQLLKHGHKPGPSLVLQGDSDTLNNVALGKTLLDQQVRMRRISTTPKSVEQRGDWQAADPGGGDPCAAPKPNWPCFAGGTGWSSYPYTVKRYADARGRTQVEWWLIHGLGHNYPNGDTRSTFTDPAGPDITSAAWRFFSSAK